MHIQHRRRELKKESAAQVKRSKAQHTSSISVAPSNVEEKPSEQTNEGAEVDVRTCAGRDPVSGAIVADSAVRAHGVARVGIEGKTVDGGACCCARCGSDRTKITSRADYATREGAR